MKYGSALAVAAVIGGWPGLVSASGPTLYGQVNLSLAKVDFQGASLANNGNKGGWQLNSNSSRIGIRGDHDLDVGGLKALYQAEFGIDVDEGDAGGETFNQRNIFAGIGGRYGSVIAGRFDTPLKTAEGGVDQFNNLYGDLDNIIGGQNRSSNIIQYQTPTLWQGLTVKAAFSPGEQNDTDADGQPDDSLADTVSISATWQRNGLYAALAYETDQNARRSVDGIQRADILRAVWTWRWRALELGALLQQAKDSAPGSDLEDDSYLLSAAWYVHRFKLKAQAGRTEGKETGDKATLWALGVDYRLASSATVFSYVSQASRDQTNVEDTAAGVGLILKF